MCLVGILIVHIVSRRTLENEQFLGKTGPRTLFTITCDSGKSIINHSRFVGEEEVLLLPGREFKVVGCLDMGNQLHMIQLKEIQPPFPQYCYYYAAESSGY